MKRKRIDAGGNVVEEEVKDIDPAVVGAIETPVTNPLEIPPRAVRMQNPAPLGPWGEFLATLAILHIAVARFIRRRVLLIDLDQQEANQMRDVMRKVALQHQGFSAMLSEVRVRLRYHEQTVPEMGRARRAYDALAERRANKLAEAKAARAAELNGGQPS